MIKNTINKIICLVLVACSLNINEVIFDDTRVAKAADFNANNLIDDSKFVDVNSMSISDIQYFLEQHGSFLKDYSENGRSAAHIIYDAAKGWVGDAGGSWGGGVINIDSSTGTVSPKVILVTLQKEQSLITRTSQNDAALRTAMGYGCPDSGGCNSTYAGFTNQVNWASSQLRYNYERAYGHGYSDYQVGQTMTFSNTLDPYNPPANQDVHIDNRATASLYRYTPHVYNGNYNFWKLYDNYFDNPVSPAKELDAYISSQSTNPTEALEPGETYTAQVKYYNKGTTNWYPNEFHLGTTDSQDRISIFNGGSGWQSPNGQKNRIYMVEGNADPGNVATFNFEFKAPDTRPATTTTYRECFKPVKDSGNPSGWFDDNTKVCFNIPVKGLDQTYHYQYVSQSPSYPDYTTLRPGESTTFELVVKNTGESTWTKDTVRLATDRGRDRIPFYTRGDGWRSTGDGNRILMQEDSVAPGSEAHFRFSFTLPSNTQGGTYREYFRLVADNIGWMEDYGIYWDIKVPSVTARFNAEWQSQNRADSPTAEPITLTRGQTYNFTVSFKNNGLDTWTQDVVHLGTSHGRDRISSFTGYNEGLYGWVSNNRIKMEQSSVAPGATATFSFDLKVPDNMPTGEYKEYFQPVAEYITWMQDHGVYWRIKVQ